MSATFSFTRLGKLITKQFFENSRLYTFSILAVFGLLALVFAFWAAFSGPRYDEESTYIIFVFGLFITGCGFASISFNMLGNKDKGIYWLAVPATHFEKLVCSIFYSTIVFTIVYCLCFYIVKAGAISFVRNYVENHPGSSYTELTNFDHGFGQAIKYFIYAYFAVQALYLLGSVYFRRYSLILTTVVGAIVIFAFGYYITRINYAFMEPSMDWELVSVRKPDESVKNGYLVYSISPAITNALKYLAQFAWAPVFWLITWYRLKEKQL